MSRLADICLQLRDEDVGEGLLPNVAEAEVTAQVVYGVVEALRNRGGDG